MPAQWTAEIVGILHANRIKQTELAAHMGVTPEYLSMVLNGKREPAGAEQKIRDALAKLLSAQSVK